MPLSNLLSTTHQCKLHLGLFDGDLSKKWSSDLSRRVDKAPRSSNDASVNAVDQAAPPDLPDSLPVGDMNGLVIGDIHETESSSYFLFWAPCNLSFSINSGLIQYSDIAFQQPLLQIYIKYDTSLDFQIDTTIINLTATCFFQ